MKFIRNLMYLRTKKLIRSHKLKVILSYPFQQYE
jgi:hypothetical protein